ncbi:MAG: isopeptide-forming domain-containing fimbrial protein, partial [Lachnospiraceae bacterium]|nr:isopeptide-forming domain-containing fimbrial protein [Lachnospiraceae bacterium]
GAILADSNGVQLIKGSLTDNMSRMLGGAVYVMGDHPKYTYTMHLTSLSVHHNTAVSGAEPVLRNVTDDIQDMNSELQKKLQPFAPCADAGELFSGFIEENTDDLTDGLGTDGTGGGLWLCAYGNTVFNTGAARQVVIKDNYASGTVPLSEENYPPYTKYIRKSSEAQKTRDDINFNSQATDWTSTRRTGGHDIHADTGDSGTVIIKGVDTNNKWLNENAVSSEDLYYKTETSDGRLNLRYDGDSSSSISNPSVIVTGNIARRGGGLAADGTFLLGPAEDQASVESSLDVNKEWGRNTRKEPVTIRVSANSGGKTAHVADIPLDGVANAPLSEFDTVEELSPTRNLWRGCTNLPLELATTDGKNTIKIFTMRATYEPLSFTDKEIDPTIAEGRRDLAALIKKIKERRTNAASGEVDYNAVNADLATALAVSFTPGLTFSCVEYEMEFDQESGSWTMKRDGAGEPVESTSYLFSSKDVDLGNAKFELQSTSHKELIYDETTHDYVEQEVYQIHLFGISLSLSAANDNKPIAEKYVNKEVHADIVNFDQHFTYDIMAYVPLEATEFTISDTLVNGLEFADEDGNPSTDIDKVIESIAVKAANNHEPGKEGTVSTEGEPDRNGKPLNLKPGNRAELTDGTPIQFETDASFSSDGRTLSVKIADKPTLNVVRGKWVQVTFYARIKDEYRNLYALKELFADVDEKTASWEDTLTVKQGSPASVYVTSNGDLLLVSDLLDAIGPDEVTWAVEAPSRLFARTESGDYYATPFNDKTGNTWTILQKDTDDGQGYGSSVWTNADNRYNGRAPDANNTVAQIATDDPELNALKETPKVKGSTLVKAAEGASRLFAEVKDATGATHIYATDNNEKNGTSWHEITVADDTVYQNALKRLSNDKFTVRMLDLVTESFTLDPDPQVANGKNWPVLSAESHEGMANQAQYNVKIGNTYSSDHKTNTVTVAPETTELDVEKIWSTPDKQWPSDVESVIFTVYAEKKGGTKGAVYVDGNGKVVAIDDGSAPVPAGAEKLTVTLHAGKTKETVKDLPKLKKTSYLAVDTKMETKLGNADITFADDASTAKTTIGETEVFSTLSSSFSGNGAKFESLRDQENTLPLYGVIADNRLYALLQDGRHFATREGDTDGKGGWTQIIDPTSNDPEYDSKLALFTRAQALLGSVDGNGNVTKGTVTDPKAFEIIPVCTAVNSTVT